MTVSIFKISGVNIRTDTDNFLSVYAVSQLRYKNCFVLTYTDKHTSNVW